MAEAGADVGAAAGMAERNKAVVRQLLDAADRGDLDGVAACYAADYLDHTTSGSRRGTERASTLQAFRELQRAFPDVRHTIDDLIAEGDRVVLRVSATGTHEGELHGIEPTGRTVTMTTTAIYRFRDGLIAERWVDGAQSVEAALRGGGGASAMAPNGRAGPPRCVYADNVPWQVAVPGASFWELAMTGVSLTCFRLSPGARFETHAHVAEQVTMVLEGRLTFEIDGDRFDLGPGDAIAVPSGLPHAVSAGGAPVVAVDAWSPPPGHLGSSGET